MRLTSESLTELENQVYQNLSEMAETQGAEKVFQFCIDSAKSGLKGEKEAATRFFHIVWFISNCHDKNILNEKLLDELTKIAEYTILSLGIKPGTSRISFLYGKIYQAKSLFFRNKEENWLSLWNYHLGEVMVRSNDSETEDSETDRSFHGMLMQAESSYLLGYTGDALEAYLQAESYEKGDDDILAARIGTIRCLRMLGDIQNASQSLSLLKSKFSPKGRMKCVIDWEMAFIEAEKNDDSAPLLKALKDSGLKSQEDYSFKAWLWCHASRHKNDIDRLPSFSALKRQVYSRGSAGTMVSSLQKYCQFVDGLIREDYAMSAKLKKIGEYVHETGRTDMSDGRVLFLAAVTRWLFRVKHHRFATLTINEFIHTSLFLSQGRCCHLYSLLSDIQDKLSLTGYTARVTSRERNMMGSLRRTMLIAEMVMKIFGMYLKRKGRDLFHSGDRIMHSDEFFLKLSELFVQHSSGELKGPLQKFALFFFNMRSFPPKAQENMKQILWTKKAIDSRMFINIFEKETGRSVKDAFLEFCNVPIGIGSVSQVYRARLHNGEIVAVKIQLPGYEKLIEQDAFMIRRAQSAAKWLFEHTDSKGFYRGLMNSFMMESDFLNEADILQRLSDKCAGFDSILIPKVHQELCTKRVLVTQFISGSNIYQFASRADEQQKRRAFLTIMQFDCILRFRLNLIQLDPHPGNFIFTGDNKVAFFDLGCCHLMSENATANYLKISRAFVDGDTRKIFDAWMETGVLDSRTVRWNDDIRDFIQKYQQFCPYLKKGGSADDM
ncbi:MAG: AarF/ABC1/UbiB kinase family protein, partial [Oligoflexales bacterium]|nr:AarF/ABC1/UbiB kinase family protein [Oligoflexales bacterium]